MKNAYPVVFNANEKLLDGIAPWANKFSTRFGVESCEIGRKARPAIPEETRVSIPDVVDTGEKAIACIESTSERGRPHKNR